MSYWLLRQQSNIYFISVKVTFSNFGLTTNPLLLPYPVSQSPFHPDNNAIQRTAVVSTRFEKSRCGFLSLPPEPAGKVAATAAADPEDFKEMAAEQNHCAELQHLLGGTSLKLAFCQAGAQRLVDDVSTGVFRPICSPQLQKRQL
jgi:hypothetical protein